MLLDSVTEAGDRLSTMEIEFPRLVLAEFNTHRMFSRNSASSRAIPVAKQLRRVLAEPFVPERFGRNQAGMQSDEWLEGLDHDEAVEIWLTGRDRGATSVFELLLGRRISGEVFGYNPAREFATLEMLNAGFDDAIRLADPKHRAVDLSDTEIDPDKAEGGGVLDVHKQIANRILEPFMWHTVIVTATEWSNFFALRAHEAAQAEIRTVAELMKGIYADSEPTLLHNGEWHLPLIQAEERDGVFEKSRDARKISAARCARVSYLTHDGKRDLEADLDLYNKLTGGGHMSPLEHPATPDWIQPPLSGFDTEYAAQTKFHGNFKGWKQLRKFVHNEHDFGLVRRAA